MRRPGAHGAGALLGAMAIALGAMATAFGGGGARCDCELRSWVVAGKGRHLFLEVKCPDPIADLSDVVEYTSAALRVDYRAPEGGGAAAPPIAKMTKGVRLGPAFGAPDNRLEASWRVDAAKAACLVRDRVFERAYFILGPNSNSGLRAACEACGLEMPESVLEERGPLGAFPGVGMTPGQEVAPEGWDQFGITRGGL